MTKENKNLDEAENSVLNIGVSHSCINDLLPLIADDYHAKTNIHQEYYTNTCWGTINGKIFIRCQLNPIPNCG